MNLNIIFLSCSSSFSVTPIIGILLFNVIRCHFVKSCFILDKALIFFLDCREGLRQSVARVCDKMFSVAGVCDKMFSVAGVCDKPSVGSATTAVFSFSRVRVFVFTVVMFVFEGRVDAGHW